MLSRSTNPFTAEVLPYVNHPEYIMIGYMDDEKTYAGNEEDA